MEGRYGERSVESKVGEVKYLGVIGHGVHHHRSKMLVPKASGKRSWGHKSELGNERPGSQR